METIADKLGISKKNCGNFNKEAWRAWIDREKAKIDNFDKYSKFKCSVPNTKEGVKTRNNVDSNGNIPIKNKIHIEEVLMI